jgi:hypothetical protein
MVAHARVGGEPDQGRVVTALQRQQFKARMRNLRVVIEGGSVRFVPVFYGNRDLTPDRRMTFDRMGKK